MTLRENVETQNSENMVECNFNNYVFVKLTESGLRIYEQYIQEYGLEVKDYPLEVDLKGFAKIQLWELMRIFGKEMTQAKPNFPFDFNFQIEVEPKENGIKKVISSAQKDPTDILDENICVNIESGDITKIKSDALITPINSGGMWFGAIDGVIQRIAGSQFHGQAQKKLPLIHGNTVVAKKLEKHNGMFGDVIFVIDDLEGPLNEIILKGLKSADNAGYNSVTMPTMRMGVMLGVVEKTPEETIKQMKLGVEKFKKEGVKNIKNITFVVYNDDRTKKLLEQSFSI